MLRYARKLVRAAFNKASSRLDAVDVVRPQHELVVVVASAVVAVKAHIH